MYAEFANTVSHIAASRYFAECIENVRGVTQSRWCNGTRSWITVDRSPARCGGYIQSL